MFNLGSNTITIKSPHQALTSCIILIHGVGNSYYFVKEKMKLWSYVTLMIEITVGVFAPMNHVCFLARICDCIKVINLFQKNVVDE